MANTASTQSIIQPINIGSGIDLLTLQLNEDAWNGDAQFTISVDGQTIGGTQTVTALRSASQTQAVNVRGNFGSGAHKVTVTFLNDADGGTTLTDRNLFVTSGSIDNSPISFAPLSLLSNGSQSISFTGDATGAPDTIDLQLSEDAWEGDAQFTIAIDGVKVGGTQTVTASHAAGQTQEFRFGGNWGAGPHSIAISFINDAWGGTSSTDRNLYVNQVQYDSQSASGAPASLFSNGTANFTVPAATGSSAPVTSTSSGVTPFYAASSFWNQPIGTQPAIDPNSAAMVAKSIVPYAGNANFADTNDWGIGLAYAHAGDKTYTIGGAIYYDTGPVSFRIPAGATPTTGSDHHLVVIDGNQELDMWQAQYNAATDTWTAGSRFITTITGSGAMGSPGQHAGGAVAAGFAEMGGVVRPEEIAQGHIDHALSITLPLIRANFIAAPATATDGASTDPAAIPEGAHLQLDPSFNVNAQSWPAWEKIIATALQTYGAFVSDTGGSIGIYGQTDINAGNTTWASANTPKGGGLSDIPWNEMRVLTLPNHS